MGFLAKDKTEATEHANTLLKKIKYPGFKIDVWHNLHWCYAVRSKHLSVTESVSLGGVIDYIVRMNNRGDTGGSHCSGYFGTEPSRASDPNTAIEIAIKEAYKVHIEIGEVLGKIVESIDAQVNFFVGIEIPGDKRGKFITGSAE